MTALPDIPPDWGLRSRKERNTRSVAFGDSQSQRSMTGIHPTRQGWSFQWSQLSEAEKTQLEDFFDGLGTDYFTWTPEGQDTELKFVTDAIECSLDEWGSWTAMLEAVQVFDV